MTVCVVFFMTVPSSVTVPVGAPVSAHVRGEDGWTARYRAILRTPQSAIGAFAASDAALADFLGRARRVPPEVSEAWKTVLRLKSEDWDVRTCVDYQRARSAICEYEQATGNDEGGDYDSSADGPSAACLGWLDREVKDCRTCSTEGACRSR
jgi:hypothetical protein